MSFSSSQRSLFKALPLRVLSYLFLVLLISNSVTLTDAQDLQECFDEFQELVVCQLEYLECLDCPHPISLKYDGACHDIDSLCDFAECCENCRDEMQANIYCHYDALCSITDTFCGEIVQSEPDGREATAAPVSYSPAYFPEASPVSEAPIVISVTEAPVTGEPVSFPSSSTFPTAAPVVTVTGAPVTGEPVLPSLPSTLPPEVLTDSPITPAPVSPSLPPSELTATPTASTPAPVPFIFNGTALLESARTPAPSPKPTSPYPTIINIQGLIESMRTPSPIAPPTMVPGQAPTAAPTGFIINIKELIESAASPAPTPAPMGLLIDFEEQLNPTAPPAPTETPMGSTVDLEGLLESLTMQTPTEAPMGSTNDLEELLNSVRPRQRLVPGNKLSIYQVKGAQEKSSSW